MKKILLIIILLLLSPNTFSQVSIEDLDDPSPYVRSNALLQIQDMKLTGFTEALEERIFEQPEPFMIDQYLRTLKDLESPKLYEISKEFISVSDNFNNMIPAKDPLESKVMATEVLFSFNDYSTVEYVFEILNRDRPKINGIAFSLLKEIIISAPEYEQMAKEELLYIVSNIPAITNGPVDFYRYNAISTLYAYYGSEVQENVIDLFENDPFLPTRSTCLTILTENNYQNLNQLLKERLLVDPDWPMRISIADSILTRFGEPSDLKTVIDYQPHEPNETARSLMGYAIEEFIPPKPDTLSYNDLCENLISCADEMFQYGWIQNEETQAYYIQKLNDINEAVKNNNARAEACSIINEQILPKAEQDLKEKLITTEGYKFLHYYTIYIKEEIEDEFGHCP